MKDIDIRPGMLVCVATTASVSNYLHGAPATVTQTYVGKDFDGSPLHEIKLHNKIQNITTLRCRANQLDG